MNRKGVSIIISVVLLIALSLTLAFAIYSFSVPIIHLSPEVDCLGLDFKAEFNNGKLSVVNLGSLPIKGFLIKKYGEGELEIYEDIVQDVLPGATEEIFLTQDYSNGRYFIVPEVEGLDGNEQQFIGACKDLYGFDINFN